MDFVERCIHEGSAPWYAFLLKLVFTAITLAAGYKGGEIVPTFFVGAAFGAVAGPLLARKAKQAGVVYAAEQIVDLIANGVTHIHVYSMNKPEIAAAIQSSLSALW